MMNDRQSAAVKQTSTANIACALVSLEPKSDAPINQSVIIKSLALAEFKLGTVGALVGSESHLPNLISDAIGGLQQISQELTKIEQKDTKDTTLIMAFKDDYLKLFEKTKKVNDAFHSKKDEVRGKIAYAPDIADFDKKFPNIARTIQTEVSDLYNEADNLLYTINSERHSLIERYSRLYSVTSKEDILSKNLKSPESFEPTYKAVGQARPALSTPTARVERVKAEQKPAPTTANEKVQPTEQKDEHKPT